MDQIAERRLNNNVIIINPLSRKNEDFLPFINGYWSFHSKAQKPHFNPKLADTPS